MSAEPEPLTPEQIDALLRPDPRTAAADLLVLRDALQRLSGAWQRIADAAGQLSRAATELEGKARLARPRLADAPGAGGAAGVSGAAAAAPRAAGRPARPLAAPPAEEATRPTTPPATPSAAPTWPEVERRRQHPPRGD